MKRRLPLLPRQASRSRMTRASRSGIMLPLGRGPRAQDRALLVVDHEHTDEVPTVRGWDDLATAPLEQVETAVAAQGLAVVEIERVGRTGRWKLVTSGHRPFNRRITGSTPFVLTGPAAGDDLLRTAADPTGRRALGTLDNCAGDATPWGTTLHGEESFHQYFEVSGTLDPAYVETFRRYGLPVEKAAGKSWSRVDERFDLSRNPNEANRFGWVVELDPYDPDATPRKRTMLGRFKHEGATVTIAADGRAVVYLGDDRCFGSLYTFVSRDRYRRGTSASVHRHNMSLLDHGTLYAARSVGDGPSDRAYDGVGEWIPLTTDRTSLVPGFSVAEVLVNTRLAADLMGSTTTGRPEGVERNPVTGSVDLACSNHTSRTPERVEPNPRPDHTYGHLIELVEDGDEGGGLDDRTVVVAVQHPGELVGAMSDPPASHWPYGDEPRPSVACVWTD